MNFDKSIDLFQSLKNIAVSIDANRFLFCLLVLHVLGVSDVILGFWWVLYVELYLV